MASYADHKLLMGLEGRVKDKFSKPPLQPLGHLSGIAAEVIVPFDGVIGTDTGDWGRFFKPLHAPRMRWSPENAGANANVYVLPLTRQSETNSLPGPITLDSTPGPRLNRRE
jgi:hypothetical protein